MVETTPYEFHDMTTHNRCPQLLLAGNVDGNWVDTHGFQLAALRLLRHTQHPERTSMSMIESTMRQTNMTS